jgi:hypothetical protein
VFFFVIHPSGETGAYLDRLDNYLQISEKSGYDLDSEIDLLWGGQNPFLSDDITP